MRFGKLTLIRKKGHRWLCRCDCGQLVVNVDEGVNGHRTACRSCVDIGNEYVSPPKLMEWVSWLSYEELIDCFDYWLSDIWSRSVGRCVEHNDWLMGGLKLLSWEWLSFAKWLEDTGGIGGGGLKRVNMGESLSNENYYWGRIDGGWADMFMIKHLFPPLRVQGTVRSIEQELNILETWE